MNVVDAILAPVLGLILLYVLGHWVFYPVKFFTVDLYRHLRYTRHGVCPKCHQPASAETRPVDQTYGPSQITRLVCSCGGRAIPMGNRRFGDWAGF